MATRSLRGGAELRPLVGDLRQLASVRRIVLDDGPERGVQALAFSTGGGLDFWVLCDRSFDIGPLSWRGTPVAWQGPNGFTSPALRDPESENGFGFERLFSGFLVTCGLDHVRQPANGRPLHGRFPFTPGRLLAHGEDWNSLQPLLYCEGEVTQASLNGERLRLRRRIEAPIGGDSFRILDEIENIGSRREEIALLYHLNFGFPLVGPGTTVAWQDGEMIVPTWARSDHRGEAAVTCLPTTGRSNNRCVISRKGAGGWRGLAVELDWDASALPWLQVWTDPRPHRHVIGLEPVTSARRPDGTSEAGPVLAAGETMRFRTELRFTDS